MRTFSFSFSAYKLLGHIFWLLQKRNHLSTRVFTEYYSLQNVAPFSLTNENLIKISKLSEAQLDQQQHHWDNEKRHRPDKHSPFSFQDILESIPHTIWISDPSGKIIYINNKNEFNLRIDSNWQDEISPKDRAKVLKEWNKCLLNGTTFDLEFRIKKKTEYCWVISNIIPMNSDRGHYSYWLGTFIDINKEKKIQQYQQKLIQILESSTDLIGLSDLHGKEIYANQAVRDLLYIKEDHTAKSVEEYVLKGDVPCLRDIVSEILKKGSWEGEFRLRNFTTNETVAVYSKMFATRDENGNKTGFATISRDIREQKKILDKLKSNEERLSFILNAIPQMVWIVSPDRRLTACNQRWSDYTGYSKQPDIPWEKLVHPDDMHILYVKWDEALKTGETFSQEFRLKGKDGNYRWFLTQALPIYDDKHNLIEWYGTNTDIEEQKRIAELLAEVGNQFKLIAESVPHAIWRADPDGNVDYYNSGIAKLTGHNEYDRFLNLGWKEIIHPEDLEKVSKGWEEALIKGTNFSEEFRVRNADGTYHWFLSLAGPLKNPSGQVVKYFGTWTNIDKIKEFEQKLIYQSELTKTITDNAASGLILINAKGISTYINPAAEKILGFSFEELKDKTLHESIHFKRQDGSYFPISDCPLHNAYLTATELINVEDFFIRKDGTFFPVTYSVLPLNDFKGSVLEFKDTTEEKRRTRQLQLLAEVSLKLNSNISFKEKLEYIGEKARELIGTNQSVIFIKSGLDLETLHSWASLNSMYANREEEIKTKIIHSELYNVVTRENKIINMNVREVELANFWKNNLVMKGILACPLTTFRGENIGLIYLSDKCQSEFNKDDEFILVQLSQLVSGVVETMNLVEREHAAVKARDEFLSLASHELKTPLTSLKLQSQMTKKYIESGRISALTPEKLSYMMTQFEKQIQRLGRLTDDMLDISRISRGKLNLQTQHLNLYKIVKDVVDKMNPQFIEAGYPPLLISSPVEVLGQWDRMRIEQVINNLLTNALKYGLQKQVEIKIQNFEKNLKISVIDHGIGIAKGNQTKIFKRFERAVNANEISGLGLGLFITRQIVKAHGGKISVESKLNHGATFIVELPTNLPRINEEAIDVS